MTASFIAPGLRRSEVNHKILLLGVAVYATVDIKTHMMDRLATGAVAIGKSSLATVQSRGQWWLLTQIQELILHVVVFATIYTHHYREKDAVARVVSYQMVASVEIVEIREAGQCIPFWGRNSERDFCK